MNNKTQDLAVLAKRFKVEELKQRIEFDIAMEEIDADAAESSWKERKSSVSVEVGPDGKPVVKGSVSW